MKLYFITFALLTFSCVLSKAQEIPEIRVEPNAQPLDIRIPIAKAIAHNFNSDLLHKTPKDLPYFISIALAFDEEGKIDTVFFSKNISKRTLETIKPNTDLIRKIKEIGIVYKNYKSKIVLFPILFNRMDDKGINYDSGFLNDYVNLWPDFGQEEKRPLVLLKPYINAYHESHK
ncbi:hypothetical protein [Pedobacter steynii]|uniref:Uncharacterized protein n=1 Tax=Pedobacter steynii TaxID=430522 RepID=A0A1D7QFA7_9SPHI|nr:hypothetical protein [Pedobacter steynii]AOM77372.1 hypothetical protein BFS30_09465 [Pedobacter steynii]